MITGAVPVITRSPEPPGVGADSPCQGEMSRRDKRGRDRCPHRPVSLVRRLSRDAEDSIPYGCTIVEFRRGAGCRRRRPYERPAPVVTDNDSLRIPVNRPSGRRRECAVNFVCGANGIAEGRLCRPEHWNPEGWSERSERNPKKKTHNKVVCLFLWCARRESNPHALASTGT